MRPRLEVSEKDRREIHDMAGLGMRYADIAIIKGISLATLKRRYKKELTTGRKLGTLSLLKTAHYMAVTLRCKTMLCFLLKTQAGLREKSHVNMTVNEKRPKDLEKRESLPFDPVMAAKTYREIITRG